MTNGKRLYKDFAVGEVFRSPTRTITEADVMLYAGLSGDWNEIHTSRTFAEDTALGRRISHGLLVLSIANGLSARVIQADTLLLGFENLKFVNPTFFGDTIYLESTLEDLRLTKNPQKGIMTWKYEIFNQHDQLLIIGTVKRMIDNTSLD